MSNLIYRRKQKRRKLCHIMYRGTSQCQRFVCSGWTQAVLERIWFWVQYFRKGLQQLDRRSRLQPNGLASAKSSNLKESVKGGRKAGGSPTLGWSPHSKKQKDREFFNLDTVQIPKACLGSSSPGSGSFDKYLLKLYCVQVQCMLEIQRETM